ncbi:Hint domain-containing protein [Roseovarius aestuariivivens]|uniref:Hint domain-containing protein n=1 Tax=Roseovarius aestuariivivens TaxID=1888910 RepID=UPI0010805D5A|nr:Hint domain-containing protein [Roseovarius aestuariivivens]
MATTFNVISLGNLASIDPTEGNTVAGNAGAILGTYGSAGAPLHQQVQQLTPGSFSGGDPANYDTDNTISNDTFRIDGGALQTFDAVAAYTATITYIDGTTATITAVIIQDTAGNTYLAPRLTQNASQDSLEAAPIQSISLDSVFSNDANFGADRDPGDFIEPVDGTAGADSIGAGFVDAQGNQIGSGDDYVLAGSGDDTIETGAGADTIEAGDGDDLIDAGAGADSVSGGAGDDTFVGGAGADTFDGNAGSDKLDYSASGAAVNVNLDTFTASGGDAQGDVIANIEDVEGSDFNDTLTGYDGTFDGRGISNILDGGAGDDLIDGRGGDDILTGGTGNDTLTGGTGDDLFVYDPGDGSDTITDFNFGTTGTISDGDASNNDFINLSGFYDNLSELYADQADDGVLNQSNTTDTKGRSVDYSDNTQFGGESLTFSGASADNTSFTAENTGVVCFAKGTRISVPGGACAIEDLRPGMAVLTRDARPQTVQWVGSTNVDTARMSRDPGCRPVRLRKGCFGAERDLLVSAQHGLLMYCPASKEEVFIRATHLARMRGGTVRIARGVRMLRYYHLLLDRHQVILANGVWAESLYPGPMALRMMPPTGRADLLVAMHGLLLHQGKRDYGPAARRYLRMADVKSLHLRDLSAPSVMTLRNGARACGAARRRLPQEFGDAS